MKSTLNSKPAAWPAQAGGYAITSKSAAELLCWQHGFTAYLQAKHAACWRRAARFIVGGSERELASNCISQLCDSTDWNSFRTQVERPFLAWRAGEHEANFAA